MRRLSGLISVSAKTISSAFNLLENRKFVRAEVGRGTFVVPDWQFGNTPAMTSDAASPVSDWSNENDGSSNPGRVTSLRALPMLRGTRSPWRRNALIRASSRLRATFPAAMECSTGRPDAKLLPMEVIRQAWANCVQEFTPASLQYAGTEPIQPLADILIPIFENDLIPARAQDLIVGSSAQQFFALIYEVVCLKSEKSNLLVAVEEPGYPTYSTRWSELAVGCWALR